MSSRRFLRAATWNRCPMSMSTRKKNSAKMNRRSSIVLAAALSALWAITAAADKPASAPADPAYQQSFDKWKGELVEGLKREWLPLAGLFWLKPGENSFGSDPKNAIV